jgi:hypothetical protein
MIARPQLSFLPRSQLFPFHSKLARIDIMLNNSSQTEISFVWSGRKEKFGSG